VVAPEWKYRAYELARATPPDGAVVGRVMDDETVAAHGEAADEFGADVTVRRATDDADDDRGTNAEPGKPAIHISGPGERGPDF